VILKRYTLQLLYLGENEAIFAVNNVYYVKKGNNVSRLPQVDILKIDEEFIYEKFPFQEDSPYCISIKQLLPMTEAIYVGDLIKNVNYIIGTPKKNYFGVNFVDQTYGIFRI